MVTVDTTSNTIVLDFKNHDAGIFKGLTPFAIQKFLAFGESFRAERVDFFFEITEADPIAFLEIVPGVKMSDGRWDAEQKKWQPDAAGYYWMKGVFDGTDWIVEINNTLS